MRSSEVDHTYGAGQNITSLRLSRLQCSPPVTAIHTGALKSYQLHHLFGCFQVVRL